MNTTLEFEAKLEKLYDLEMVSQLCRGDRNLIKKMVQLFIKDIPASIEEIKQAYRDLDFSTLKKTAHRIKPILAMYSILKIEKDIEILENSSISEMAYLELETKINNLCFIIGKVTQHMKDNFS
jgi:HPt (histidine-containing phosphotransfer) domain-containing protein